MHKKISSAKIGIIFMISILALASISAGYALWFEDLTINGTVNTGTLEWKFKLPVTISDNSAPPPYYDPTNPNFKPDYNCDPNLGLYGPGDQPFIGLKNVAWGTATKIDDHTLQMTINEVYPGYYNHLDFWVQCTGTVPLVIDRFIVTDIDGNELVVIRDTGIFEFDISGDGINDMQIDWGHPFGEPASQLHTGDKRDVSFGFCFLQPLPEDATIILYLSLIGVQYNEWQP